MQNISKPFHIFLLKCLVGVLRAVLQETDELHIVEHTRGAVNGGVPQKFADLFFGETFTDAHENFSQSGDSKYANFYIYICVCVCVLHMRTFWPYIYIIIYICVCYIGDDINIEK